MRQPASLAPFVLIPILTGGAALAAPAATTDLRDRANQVFHLRASEIATLDVDGALGGPITADVLINGTVHRLELGSHSVRAPGFQVFHQVAGGELVSMEPGPVRTLRGTVANVPGTTVVGSLLEDGLHVSVELPDGRYWVQPIGGFVDGAAAGQYVVYRHEDVIPSGGTCACGHHGAGAPPLALDVAAFEGSGEVPGGIAGGVCYSGTELACDADFPYFQDWGAQTESRIETVINAINNQYESQVDITHLITAIVVRTSPEDDPYTTSDPGALVGQFRSHWLQNHAAIPRDVAHLFTGRNLSGSVIGIAFDIAAICTDQAYCLSQSDCCSPNFPCATDLSAHELGHLWGAFHCSCPSGTMNASLTCANFFTNDSVNSIVAHRNSRTCLTDYCLVQPNDDCGSATVVPSGISTFSNLNAVTDGFGEACFGGQAVESDVWFSYTAECDGFILVRLCESSYDTRLAVYDASCPSGPNQAIACNDNFCGVRSQVQFDATVGTEYLIRVGGFEGAEGLGEMFILFGCDAPCPTDITGDGETDVQDLTALILAWGTDDADADCNGDGIVDVQDLTLLIVAWGPCP